MQFPLLYIHISRGTYADDVNHFLCLFQPIQCPGLLFSSVIIFHRRQDTLDEWWDRRKAATYTQENTNTE
jgi:hypothetical protein